MSHYKVIIIGTGPAGYTAGIYASRANLAPLILEGTQPGGQLTITTEVENFPGFPAGIQGPELMNDMREQVLRFGAELKAETVLSADLAQRAYAPHPQAAANDPIPCRHAPLAWELWQWHREGRLPPETNRTDCQSCDFP